MDFDRDSNDSDEELQEAFAAGKLKPGLNIPTTEKKWKNNVTALNQKLEEIKLKLPWIERMDINTAPAPMAPEMFHEINEKEKNSVVRLKTNIRPGVDGRTQATLVLDDFKREMLFHRQAQAALVEGVKRLTNLGIPTQRPEDYFAEMAKSDQHMHKVRESLAARQKGVQRSERVSELRRQKKLSKQTQIENKLQQAKEKKKMLNEVQKFRRGIRKDLDFLDGKEKPKPKPGLDRNKKSHNKRGATRKEYKDKKFGFGGLKRGSKRNTKESSANFGAQTLGKSGGKNKGKPMRAAQKRPGKSRRMNSRGRK